MKISNSHKIRTLATLECFVQNIRQIEGRSRLWTVFDEFFVTFRFFFFLAKFLSKTCSDTRYCRCKGYFCSFGKATLAYLYSILPKIILPRRSFFCRLRNVYFLGMILPLIFCLKINEIHKPSYFDKTSLGQQADAALQQVLVLLLSVRSIALTRILDSATQKDLLKGIMTSLFFLPRILFAQGRLKNGKATHKKTSRALEKRSERTVGRK